MKLVIGLVGTIGSGKGAASDRLKKKHGAAVLTYSRILTDVLERLAADANRKNLQSLGASLRKALGPDVLVRAMRRDIASSEADLLVIDGIRYENEVEMLREFENSVLIGISAPEKVRYERAKSRGEKGERNVTREEFIAAGKRETERRVEEILETCDFLINNSGTLEDFEESVDALAAKLLG